MRHAKKRLQLNRFTSWHEATLKSLARSALLHQSIKTTLSRAKAVRPLVEKLITLGKANTLAAKRKAFSLLGDHKLVTLLFNELAPRFADIKGGYTRIIQAGQRRGDGAQAAIFELTVIKKKEPKKTAMKKEAKPVIAAEGAEPAKEAPVEEKKTAAAVKERPPVSKKPNKKFLGGLRNIFKKERDSL